MSLPTFKIVSWTAGLAALLLLSGSPTRASEQNTAGNQSAYQTPIVLPSRLQVTGTAQKISIDAEHSDVQSALKAVLKQAGKQFQPDASVTGQVTLLLTDQPLDSVLRAICDQSYLRFTTTDGIYKFSRDDEAIQRAFTQLNTLNALLRQRLRSLGLEIPTDEILSALVEKDKSAALGGGFGGGVAPSAQDATRRDEKQTNDDKASKPAGRAGTANEPAPTAGAARALNGTINMKKDAQGNIANIHTDFINQGDISQFLGNGARIPNAQQYSMFLRQNNFVWFNIPEEKPAAVASILQQFSQQANVPILLDQSIPNSLKFRVWGSLSPRQLPEALNVLSPTAHLQWRWIGGTVFVFPSPDFQVYFGDTAVPSNSTRDRRGNK